MPPKLLPLCRTRTVYRSSQPQYDEELFLENFPAHSAPLELTLWDRNFGIKDELVASAVTVLNLSRSKVGVRRAGARGDAACLCCGEGGGGGGEAMVDGAAGRMMPARCAAACASCMLLGHMRVADVFVKSISRACTLAASPAAACKQGGWP